MREIYWHDWFERAGDVLIDDHDARTIYRAGLWNTALPNGGGASDRVVVKWMGTFGPIEPTRPADIILARVHADARFWSYVLDPATRAQAGLAPSCAHRWDEGIARLGRLTPAQSRGRSAIRSPMSQGSGFSVF